MTSKPTDTASIRTQISRTQYKEHSTPLFLTSSFIFESAETMQGAFAGDNQDLIYSRYDNPNTNELIEKVCKLEGAEDGIACASGMAAIFVTLGALLKAGDHVLATRALFGSTHQLLTQIFSKWGIEHTYVEAQKPEDWAKAIRPSTRLFFLETPSNPGLELVDLKLAGELCKAHQIPLIVDNCFATPCLQRPIEFGASIVTHSATKWMDGQGRTMGGLTVGTKALIEPIRYFARHTGPAMSPFNAWTLSKSLETLWLRMEHHCRNAAEIASRLEAHAKVKTVRYPFLQSHPQHDLARRQMSMGGGLVSFDVGGIGPAHQMINQLKLCSLSADLGDTRTIITHPSTTTHSKLTESERLAVGITPGLVRISCGLEDVEDIWADLAQALDAITL